ncbi:MAG TPA: hypothetical protein VIF63_09300 [Candidatus Limnocylindrales bacterium]
MTHDPRRPSAAESFDDDTIGKLVRETAADWTMPPVRLDAPAWRDRVRGARARRVAVVQGWFGRVGQAATAAVALTVAAALVAVILTGPPPAPGKSPEPSTGATPGATSGALPSPLPKLFVDGEVPEPTTLLVQVEPGDLARVDLTKGVLGRAVTGAQFGSGISVHEDGSIVCLCVTRAGSVDGMPTQAIITFKRFDEAGSLIASAPVDTISGVPDPRDVGKPYVDRPSHVLTSIGSSADGRYGFVGWSKRAPPVWQSGVLVVDLADGTVVSRLALPDEGTGDGDGRRVIDAPSVVGTTFFLRLLIARSWYEWSPVSSENPSYDFHSDAFAASFKGGDLTGAERLAAAADCGEVVTRGGVAGDSTWLGCQSGGGSTTVIRRLAGDGTKIDDVRVFGIGGIDADLTAVSPDGAYLYAWNPISATLTRVDLATGETTTAQGAAQAAVERGPLAAFGEWLAPTAAAKVWLLGGMAVSPDGSRVYALGIANPASEAGGSTGVYAFDGNAMASVGHWQPTADFVSLAVSPDGRFVYAAGLPGVDAKGNSMSQQSASITVFDASDGSPRLIAGALGRGNITFTSSVFD